MPESTTYTLEGLVDRVGPATDDDATLFTGGFGPDELIKQGRRVASPRIATDATRLLGTSLDFLGRSTAAQRRAVPGLTPELLKAAVWATFRSSSLAAERAAEKGARTGGRAVEGVGAAGARAALVGSRDVLYETLVTLAAGDGTRRARIDQAYGKAGTPAELAKAVTGLTAIAREMRSDADPGMVARRAADSLAADWLAALDRDAAAYETAATSAAAPVSDAPVRQPVVDLWDGIALYLLRRVIDIHEAGHGLDLTIPRLVPISLRSFFGLSAAAEPATETTEPTTP